MYGIVNRAIEDLVVDNFGGDKWEEILTKSDIDVDFFISNEPYDDEITYKLAGAASEVLGITVGEVLFAFGEWWILKTGKEKYGGMMSAGGHNLKEFMLNLPAFHNRIMLIYPKLTPPEFQVSNVGESQIDIHYYSKREGLQEFVHGLLSGLGKMYETPLDIELIQSRDDGSDHEVFRLNW